MSYPLNTYGTTTKQKPDPFNEAERDALLGYFRKGRRRFFPFVLTAFWTGARPSELIALRWGDVDPRTHKLMVRRSRTLHEDNAPKTEGSERTIDLAPAVADVLARLKPLHATDEAFVFTNSEGRPIFGDSFTKHEWHRALRSAGVRPRKFYATRHTFISLALSRGARPKWVAEYRRDVSRDDREALRQVHRTGGRGPACVARSRSGPRWGRRPHFKG